MSRLARKAAPVHSAPVAAQPVSSLRRLLEAAVEQAIACLDALDGDPDLEAVGDDEPSLGAVEGGQRLVVAQRDREGRAIRMNLTNAMDQTRWADHATHDLEAECEDEGAQCDDEGHDSDREQDDADLEPALGSQECDRGGTIWNIHSCVGMSVHEDEPDGRSRLDVRAGRLSAGRLVTNRGEAHHMEMRGRYPVRMFPLIERGA